MTAALLHAGGPTAEALYDFRAGRLHPDAAQWIAVHVDGCPECAALLGRIEAVRVALEPPPEPPFMRQADLAAVRQRLVRRAWVPWRPMAWAGVAGAVAGLALVLLLRPPGGAPAAGAEVGFALLSRQGAARVELGAEHSVAEAKMQLPAGAWLDVAPQGRVVASWAGARVAVEGGADGARVQLAQSRIGLRRLALLRGRVVLDVNPLAPGQRLAVRTAGAEVVVHGTRFLVEATTAGTAVAVDRGRVAVALDVGAAQTPALTRTVAPALASATAPALALDAGFELLPGGRAPAPLSAEHQSRLQALTGAFPAGPSESLEVFANVATAEVAVDGIAYGLVPLSLAVSPGVHTVRVRAAGRLPIEERLEVLAGAPVLFRAELSQLPGVEEAEARPTAARPTTALPAGLPAALRPGAGELLARARADVLDGQYDRAILRLGELDGGPATALQHQRAALLEAQAERLARRPERALPLLQTAARGDGPEAEQAAFQLAQTLDRDLHDPVRAAAAYAEAERRFPHGTFAEESAVRRGEALLSMGDTHGGIEALERYLQKFPAGAHVEDAHLSVASARRDRLGDCAGAVPHLLAVAATRGPRSALALIGAARCLGTLGRAAAAQAEYGRYLGLQPHGRYAEEARAAVGVAR